MTFDVKITAKDLFRFSMYHTFKGFKGILLIVFSLGCFAGAIYTYGQVDFLNTCVMILLGALFTVVNPVMLYVKCMKRVKKVPSYSIPTHYVLTKKGFMISQEGESMSLNWVDLYEIVWKKKAAYFCLDPMHAQIISLEELGAEKAAELKAFLKNEVSDEGVYKKGLR